MQLPKLLLGTFQNNNFTDLFEVVKTSIDCGFSGFDTAPSYGTEEVLGDVLKRVCYEKKLLRSDFFISDKIDAWQMQESKGNVRKHVISALKKLQTDYIDLYLVHWPVEEYIIDTWECLIKLQEEGVLKNIGICNVRKRHIEAWNTMGIKPKYIQIERHPLRTCDLEMEYCKEKNIYVISYSPLCRMHPTLCNSNILKEIAAKHKKNIGQIILRWHIDTNAVPVFMTTKTKRVRENMELFDFSLEKEDIDSINKMNQNYKIFLESWGCPGF